MRNFESLPLLEKQKKICESLPYDCNSWMELGRLYEAKGDPASAYRAYRRVLKIRPDNRFAREKIRDLGTSLRKNDAELREDLPLEIPNEKLSRPCPCCGKDVSDPTHVKMSRFPYIFINLIKAQRAQRGRADLKLDDNAFIVFDQSLQRPVNMIHVLLKLDGQDGRPRVDTFNQLTAFLGWGPMKAADLMDMITGIMQYESFLHLINITNPTPEEDIDLTDLIAIIRDGGWDFYDALSRITVGELTDKEGHMTPEKFPEFTQPIYVKGKSSDGLSFPAYFCYNTFQSKIINFKCWADYFKAMHSVGNFSLFMIQLKLLHDKNHMWCDLWWKSHQRLNGIASPISLEESRTRDPPAPSYIEPTWFSIPHPPAGSFFTGTIQQQPFANPQTSIEQPQPPIGQNPPTKKFCMYCGKELPLKSKFCNKCGIKCEP